MGRLDGKVALITGAARGQGAAEARLFADEGATVMVADVLDEEGAATAADIGSTASYVHLDVSNESEWTQTIKSVLDQRGRLDVLVNNAGIIIGGGVQDTSLEDYDRVIAVNQTGVFLGMRAVAGAMVEAGRGSIVNISSIAAMTGRHGTIPYTASKWAVRGMTKQAARELAPHGVRVNSIHPGAIDTPMIEGAREMLVELVAAEVPAGYIAKPEEVARLALYLASDESSYSTGSEFVVDGGWTA